uniref:TAP-C domain-containing protein n=1 Tax=Steinernema glaseri TaxID=37863 RepID=A0A1I8AU22_9BILA
MSGERRSRRDVKSRTMNRFRGLEDDDEGDGAYDNNRRRGGLANLIGRVTATTNASQLIRKIAEKRQREEARSTGGRAENRPQVYMVKIIKAGKTAPDVIFKAVSQRMVNFKPYLIRPDEKGNMLLYVGDEDSAEAIKGMSRRICDPDAKGVKFPIAVTKTCAIWNKIPPENVELIKRAVGSRFNEADLSLDLTDFGNDPEFRKHGIAVALTRNEVMIAIADIIDEHFSGITALSLRNNRLRTLDYVANFICRAPKIKTLDLSNNAIEKADQLEKLRGWNIETLFMENCPIGTTFTDGMEYVRMVHGIFPAVTLLDGVAVTRQIDVTEAVSGPKKEEPELPAVRNGFTPDPALEETIKKFIMEYLTLYDGEDGRKSRQKLFDAYDEDLFDAYDEDATFTCVQENLFDGMSKPFYPDRDAQLYYRRNSHNILHEEKWTRYRDKIVKTGRMAIAAELSAMPLTTHIMDSLVLDIFSVSDTFLTFVLQGLFRDGSQAFKNDGEMCYFSRTFTVLPRDGGRVVVANDMLTLSAISDLTLTRYKNLLTKASVASLEQPATANQAIAAMAQMSVTGAMQQQPEPVPTGYDTTDPNIRRQMVEQFCLQSGMKAEWATKCLEDQNWNYEAAGKIFMDLKDQIPRDAFQ